LNTEYNENKALYLSGAWMILTFLLTMIHHLYSSTIYAPDANIVGVFSGSWRAHGFLVFMAPVIVDICALVRFSKTRRHRWLIGYSLVNASIFVGLIGLWEGGWNHLAKIVFYTAGFEMSYAYGPSWLLQFPAVLPPQDRFFEATGVLTLVFGLINAFYLRKLFSEVRNQSKQEQHQM
jgi:hypothetical protein